MPVHSINYNDFRELLGPVLRAQGDSRLDRQEYSKVLRVVREVAQAPDIGKGKFWAEVYRDNKLLTGLARVLWYTEEWEKQKHNILALLAVQEGSVEKAAKAMKLGGNGGFFDKRGKLKEEAITIGNGSNWELLPEGGARMVYKTKLNSMPKDDPIPFELGVDLLFMQNDKSITGLSVSLKPQRWVNGVYRIGDANVRIKLDGNMVRFPRIKEFVWLPIPGKEQMFKGPRFRCDLPLSPLKSSCLSVAIARGGIHTLFIHPIGFMPKI